MRKRLMWGLLGVTMFLSVACGKKENGKVSPTKAPTESGFSFDLPDTETPAPSVTVRDLGGITITVSDWWSDENWNHAVNAYQEAYNDMLLKAGEEANFTFERKNAGFGRGEEYAAKIGEAIRTDNPPGDLIAVSLSNIGTLLRDGCLFDVTQAESVSWDDVYKWKHHNGITEFLNFNGKQYGFDWEYAEAGLGVFINKELLKMAGIDPNLLYDLQRMHNAALEPDADASKWTWEAFLDICEQLKNTCLGDDIAVVAGQDVQVVYGALLSNGTNVIEKDERGLLRVNGEDTPAVKEALTFAGELKKRGYLVSMSEEACRKAFSDGKAVFLIAEERMATEMGTSENENLGFMCFPFGPTQGKLTSIVLDDVAYFVPNCAKCKENAESILYAFNCYTEHPECTCGDSYYSHAEWRAQKDWRYADELTVCDTLTAMIENDTVPIALNATVLLAGFDHSWTEEIMNGRDIDEVLVSHRDSWTAQVEAFNKLFT